MNPNKCMYRMWIYSVHLNIQMCCVFDWVGCGGPGYRTPLDAFNNGPREKLLYVITVQPNLDEPHGDYLSTVDVDPDSPTYSQVCQNLVYV